MTKIRISLVASGTDLKKRSWPGQRVDLLRPYPTTGGSDAGTQASCPSHFEAMGEPSSPVHTEAASLVVGQAASTGMPVSAVIDKSRRRLGVGKRVTLRPLGIPTGFE